MPWHPVWFPHPHNATMFDTMCLPPRERNRRWCSSRRGACLPHHSQRPLARDFTIDRTFDGMPLATMSSRGSRPRLPQGNAADRRLTYAELSGQTLLHFACPCPPVDFRRLIVREPGTAVSLSERPAAPVNGIKRVLPRRSDFEMFDLYAWPVVTLMAND